MGSSGRPAGFLGGGDFFCFFAAGGELDRRLSSPEWSGSEFSSSESCFDRFFVAGFLRVVWVSFLDAVVLGFAVVAGFLGGAFALI